MHRRKALALFGSTLGLQIVVAGNIQAAKKVKKSKKKNMFTVVGTNIYKNNKPFIIKGVNLQGPGFPWGRNITQDITFIQLWGFNTVRLNMYLNPTVQSIDHGDNIDLDLIIKNLTDAGLITILELHDLTGKYPDNNSNPSLSEIQYFYNSQAKKYINNSLVWFNTYNEPGPFNDKFSIADWYYTQSEITNTIRATGNTNIIILDGAWWGQDAGTWNAKPIPTENSAILSMGSDLISNLPSASYKNIVYSIHVYDQWNFGTPKLEDFIKETRERNLCLIFGEYGGHNNVPTVEATNSAITVSNKYKIGKIVWSWYGGDQSKLTDIGGGWTIDRLDGSRPTNLSNLGDIVWKENRRK